MLTGDNGTTARAIADEQGRVKRQAKRGRAGAEHQEQRRPQNEVNLGYADRIVWQQLEETQDKGGCHDDANGKLGDAVALEHVLCQLGRIA